MDDSDEYPGPGSYQDSRRSRIDRVEIIESDPEVVIALWVAIGVSGVILLVCGGIYAVLKLNLLKRASNPLRRGRGENHPLRNRNPSHLSSLPGTSCVDPRHFGAYVHSGFVQDEDVKTKCVERLKDLWCIPRNFMNLPDHDIESPSEMLNGNGKYGPVYKSLLKNNNVAVNLFSVPSTVIKPSLASTEDPDSLTEFYKDLDNLISLDHHENVLQLLGYLEDAPSLIFALESADESLKTYLLRMRNDEFKHLFNPYDLLICAMNIAEGMFHLQTNQIDHGQLCARNIVLSSLTVPKISGFGLISTDPLTEKYDYARWEPVERLQNRCSRPSDPWSYGVLLWEIATAGGTPYHDIRSEDLPKRMATGNRPMQTEAIGDPLYQIMLYCWQIDRDERPDFSTLSCSVHELLPHCKESLLQVSNFIHPPYHHEYEHRRI